MASRLSLHISLWDISEGSTLMSLAKEDSTLFYNVLPIYQENKTRYLDKYENGDFSAFVMVLVNACTA